LLRKESAGLSREKLAITEKKNSPRQRKRPGQDKGELFLGREEGK